MKRFNLLKRMTRELSYMRSDDQTTDIFTKGLKFEDFVKIRASMDWSHQEESSLRRDDGKNKNN